MQWIWEHPDWPHFEYEHSKLYDYELEFHRNSGQLIGSIQHLNKAHQEAIKIDILSQEAVSTSSIEGEILDRDSVQSSIRKHLGLKTDYRKVAPNTVGISEMMVDLYLHYNQSLNHQMLFEWHKMLTNGRRDLISIGTYRQHEEPMQIVSGNLATPKLYYEAPPSLRVNSEMASYIDWFNTMASAHPQLPTLAFAGIAHLYFEMIHPFEDGNGRIGRTLAEKAISQRLGYPALLSFSKVIDLNKKAYYNAIQACNHRIKIDSYLIYFAQLTLEAQQHTLKIVEFTINKNKFFTNYASLFNPRQEKVIKRMFEEGIEGFRGGLSAKNYQVISGASPATTTRDLQELVALNAFFKTGELKHSRYYLNL
jgi:Fic family protein